MPHAGICGGEGRPHSAKAARPYRDHLTSTVDPDPPARVTPSVIGLLFVSANSVRSGVFETEADLAGELVSPGLTGNILPMAQKVFYRNFPVGVKDKKRGVTSCFHESVVLSVFRSVPSSSAATGPPSLRPGSGARCRRPPTRSHCSGKLLRLFSKRPLIFLKPIANTLEASVDFLETPAGTIKPTRSIPGSPHHLSFILPDVQGSAAAVQEPDANVQEPAATVAKPAAAIQELAAAIQEPAAAVREPPAAVQNPDAASR